MITNQKWFEDVSRATGKTPEQVKSIITIMAERGSKYSEIENHLRKLAAENGKALMFTSSLFS